jgi:hypothetical protein
VVAVVVAQVLLEIVLLRTVMAVLVLQILFQVLL